MHKGSILGHSSFLLSPQAWLVTSHKFKSSDSSQSKGIVEITRMLPGVWLENFLWSHCTAKAVLQYTSRVANKLKQLLPRILSHLQGNGMPITHIRIKVSSWFLYSSIKERLWKITSCFQPNKTSKLVVSGKIQVSKRTTIFKTCSLNQCIH